MPRIITDYLEETAKKFPNKLAVSDGKESFTFRELRTTAKKIATGLANRKIFHKPIAVCLGQTARAIAAFLGVAYSGNFYTVLDEKMPEKRLNKILTQLQPAAIIANSDYKNLGGEGVISYEELLSITENDELLTNISNNINNMDVLYVLFTSGSTGTPKGVTIGQRSVIEYTEWVADTFKFDENTTLGNQAPFYFDNSVLDIYQMIKTGATLYIIPRKLFGFPLRLMEYIRDHSINALFWVPSVLCNIANLGILNACDVSCLNKILFCGEVMPNKQLNIWRKHLPNAFFANLYGPTEITDVCAYYIVNREFSDSEPLPIGIPRPNTEILLLDENNQKVVGTAQGEICVRGSCLSYGYYNDPEKTAAAFVQNPLNTAYPDIIYRTGDIGHYNEKGELMFDGRKDSQIKHMGHRIELGEIETAAISVKDVDAVCCVHNKEDDSLVLFYAGKAYLNDIRGILKELLPRYMMPKEIRRLSVMPLTDNGKINRVKLKEMLHSK